MNHRAHPLITGRERSSSRRRPFELIIRSAVVELLLGHVIATGDHRLRLVDVRQGVDLRPPLQRQRPHLDLMIAAAFERSIRGAAEAGRRPQVLQPEIVGPNQGALPAAVVIIVRARPLLPEANAAVAVRQEAV